MTWLCQACFLFVHLFYCFPVQSHVIDMKVLNSFSIVQSLESLANYGQMLLQYITHTVEESGIEFNYTTLNRALSYVDDSFFF